MFRPRLTRRAVVIAVFVLVALIAFSRSRSRAGVFAGNASFDRVASVAGFAGAARSVDSFAPAPAVSVAAAPPAAAPAEAKSETFAPIFPTAQLVRTADLRIEVRDVATTLREADRVARSRGGLLADGHLNHAAEGPAEAQVTIRVPSDSFDVALDQLRRLGQLRTENLGTNDVSAAYVDVQTRTAVKEQTAERLRGILASRTGKLSDVLEVERELARVVTEIEQMKGQERVFDREIAMSNITVTLFEPGPGRIALVRTSIAGMLQQSVDTLVSSMGLVVAFAAFVLPWAVLGALVWMFVRSTRVGEAAVARLSRPLY